MPSVDLIPVMTEAMAGHRIFLKHRATLSLAADLRPIRKQADNHSPQAAS
jgi:hypothetical protein